MLNLPSLAASLLVLLLATAVGRAQTPPGPAAGAGVPEVIDDDELEAKILAACSGLRQRGELVACSVLARGPLVAEPIAVPVLPLHAQPVPMAELRDRVLRSLRIVGHHYRCRECDKWHFSGASGFCVDAIGTIATCQHVVPADDTMLDAALVVADLAGNTWPVQSVLAADAAMDLVLLRTPARDGVPMPLRASVRSGERVYCASNPDQQFGYFSEGLVARRFRVREPATAASELVPRVSSEWLHVTCEFAKGSSGGPIVDAMGNVVGVAQSTSTVIYDEDAQPIDTQMVFRIAAPADALLALLQPPPRSSPAVQVVPAKVLPR